MTFQEDQLALLKIIVGYLHSETTNLIVRKFDHAKIIDKVTEMTVSLASDIQKYKVDAQEAYSWCNKKLLELGFLGKYFNVDFFPLKEISNINSENYHLAEDIVKTSLNDEVNFNPSLSVLVVPDIPAPNLNITLPGPSFTSTPGPGFKKSPKEIISNVKASLSQAPKQAQPASSQPSSYPVKYLGALPPIGTNTLKPDGYAKLRDLAKAIPSKLPISSILDRFAAWAQANDVNYTDSSYKLALGSVLPDAYIRIYDSLATDPQVPFHQLAYLLSKKVGTKKPYKLARSLGEELACNFTDPPLKVLDEIEALFYSVEDKDRKMLTDEAFLLAETFLTRRFGDSFWAIFSARLESEKVDNIADLAIMFRNHFQKVAANFEDEKSSTKKNNHRLHNLEIESASRSEIERDVKTILHHLESPPLGQDRASAQMSGTGSYPSSVDGYYTVPPTLQGQCFSSHHVAPVSAPAPQQPAPIVLPVVLQGNTNGGQGGPKERPYGGPQNANRFDHIPKEKQYRFQSCMYPGHSGHLNKDCSVQMNVACRYNERHPNHAAAACIRSRDWHYGAIENPGPQRPGFHGGRPGGSAQRARPSAFPPRQPPRQPGPSGVNQIIDVLVSGLQNINK